MATRISRWFLKWAHKKGNTQTDTIHASDTSVSGSNTSEHSYTDVDIIPPSMNTDERIEVVRQGAVKCKSSFVTLKHTLMYLVCSEDTVDKMQVQDAVEEMLVAQETMDMLTELSQLYSGNGDVEMMKKISEDMEMLHKESHEAQCAAFKFVKESMKESNSEKKVDSSKDEIAQKLDMLQDQIKKLTSECNGYKKMPDIRDDRSNIDESSGQTQRLGNDLWNQLERVSIPIFSGDKLVYEGWRAAFDACVDKAPVSTVYKLLQLKKYLSGEPLKLVQRLGHSENAYEVAKSKLERKYGGKRRQTACYLEQLHQFKELRDGDHKSFEAFADLLEMAVFTLKEAGRPEELQDGTLYTTLLQKLSDRMMVDYMRWTADKSVTESVESLTRWALTESEYQVISAETREGLCGSCQKAFCVTDKNSCYERSFRVACNTENKCDTCRVCHEKHTVDGCTVFLSMSPGDRWEAARRHRLCFRCLGTKHLGKDCRQRRYCRIENCMKTHHKLLHESTYENDSGLSAGCALRTVPVVLKNGDKQVKVNALLDDASSKSYVNAHIVKKLELQGYPQQVKVGVLNGGIHELDSMSVDVELHSVDGKLSRNAMVYTAEAVTGDMTVIDWKQKAKQWPHLKDL